MTRTKRTYERQQLPPDEIGKLPPQAVDLEEAVLGACLLEDEAYHAVADMLVPEIFYKEQNGKICAAIISLKNEGQPVDILTVTQELRRKGELELVGGAYYVSQLTNRLASSANIEFHMRVVLQMFIKREIIRGSSVTIRNAYEDSSDALDCLDEYEKNLAEITSRLFIGKMQSLGSMHHQVLKDNEVLRAQEGKLIGVPTGFRDLDLLTGGWQKSDLIILAARPGMGKTALAIQFATNAAKAKRPVAIFSLEMAALQLVKRIYSQESQIPLEMLTKTGMDADTEKLLERDTAELRKNDLIHIDDEAGLTVNDFRRKARKIKREKKIELIIVDYLQLIEGSDRDGNREQQVSKISRGLKMMAKELNVPIIALSQLSRQTENRQTAADHIPKLSHLRDSGAIEQDADMVMFIYRPEVYGIEADASGQSTAGRAQVIIAKNRHGALQNVNLRWKGECTTFSDDRPAEMMQTLQPIAANNDFLNNNNSPY